MELRKYLHPWMNVGKLDILIRTTPLEEQVHPRLLKGFNYGKCGFPSSCGRDS